MDTARSMSSCLGDADACFARQPVRNPGHLVSLLAARELGLSRSKNMMQAGFDAWAEEDFLRHASASYANLSRGPRSTIAAAFNSDGELLATTHGDHTVKVVRWSTGQLQAMLDGHQRTPWVVRFNPARPQVLASGSLDHSVIVWEAESGQQLLSHNFGKPIASVAFHSAGDIMMVASGHKVYTWQYNARGGAPGSGALGATPVPAVVLKTRKSLRALHFHPLGRPLVLTAEVVERKTAPGSTSSAGGGANPTPQPPPDNPGGGAGGDDRTAEVLQRLHDLQRATREAIQAQVTALGLQAPRADAGAGPPVHITSFLPPSEPAGGWPSSGPIALLQPAADGSHGTQQTPVWGPVVMPPPTVVPHHAGNGGYRTMTPPSAWPAPLNPPAPGSPGPSTGVGLPEALDLAWMTRPVGSGSGGGPAAPPPPAVPHSAQPPGPWFMPPQQQTAWGAAPWSLQPPLGPPLWVRPPPVHPMQALGGQYATPLPAHLHPPVVLSPAARMQQAVAERLAQLGPLPPGMDPARPPGVADPFMRAADVAPAQQGGTGPGAMTGVEGAGGMGGFGAGPGSGGAGSSAYRLLSHMELIIYALNTASSGVLRDHWARQLQERRRALRHTTTYPSSAAGAVAPGGPGAGGPAPADLYGDLSTPALIDLLGQPAVSRRDGLGSPLGLTPEHGPLLPLLPPGAEEGWTSPAFDVHWGWETSADVSAAVLRTMREQRALLQRQLPLPSAQEQPCIVNLVLWPFNTRTPGSPLARPALQLPRTVLCSEMGVSFSRCGRYLAVCVATDSPSEPCAAWMSAAHASATARAAREAAEAAVQREATAREVAVQRDAFMRDMMATAGQYGFPLPDLVPPWAALPGLPGGLWSPNFMMPPTLFPHAAGGPWDVPAAHTAHQLQRLHLANAGGLYMPGSPVPPPPLSVPVWAESAPAEQPATWQAVCEALQAVGATLGVWQVDGHPTITVRLKAMEHRWVAVLMGLLRHTCIAHATGGSYPGAMGDLALGPLNTRTPPWGASLPLPDTLFALLLLCTSYLAQRAYVAAGHSTLPPAVGARQPSLPRAVLSPSQPAASEAREVVRALVTMIACERDGRLSAACAGQVPAPPVPHVTVRSLDGHVSQDVLREVSLTLSLLHRVTRAARDQGLVGGAPADTGPWVVTREYMGAIVFGDGVRDEPHPGAPNAWATAWAVQPPPYPSATVPVPVPQLPTRADGGAAPSRRPPAPAGLADGLPAAFLSSTRSGGGVRTGPHPHAPLAQSTPTWNAWLQGMGMAAPTTVVPPPPATTSPHAPPATALPSPGAAPSAGPSRGDLGAVPVGGSGTGDGSAGGSRGPNPTGQPSYELRIVSLDGPTFGRVLAARPVHAAHCLTSVQFSPTSRHLLCAYGRRHVSLCGLLMQGEQLTPLHTVGEVYRVSDLRCVRQLVALEDEVNVACWHPVPGAGLVYGTKEGKVRLFRHDRSDPARPAVPCPSREAAGADEELWQAERNAPGDSGSEEA